MHMFIAYNYAMTFEGMANLNHQDLNLLKLMMVNIIKKQNLQWSSQNMCRVLGALSDLNLQDNMDPEIKFLL